jgi:hypothetical protein
MLRALVLLAAMLTGFAQDPQSVQSAPPGSTAGFKAFDVFVEAGESMLGAWQFEWTVQGGSAHIVGVEGGDGVFARSPYHDPAALQGGRILIAAFATEGQLPRGRCRVATVHMMIEAGSEPTFAARLQSCADGEGRSIAAAITWKDKETR